MAGSWVSSFAFRCCLGQGGHVSDRKIAGCGDALRGDRGRAHRQRRQVERGLAGGDLAGDNQLVQVLAGDGRHRLVDHQALGAVSGGVGTVGPRLHRCVVEQVRVTQGWRGQGGADPAEGQRAA